MCCPLCNSKKLIKLKTYNTDEIIRTYQEGFQVEIAEYFEESFIELYQCGHCGLQYFPKGKEGKSYFYEQMSKISWYYMKEKFEYDYAIQKLIETKANSILEIGCGKGYFLEKIKDGYFVRATEQNLQAIEELKQKGIQLDDDKTQYDFVVMFQVLEHVKQTGDFLEWVLSKVRDQGYLLIAVPNPDSAYMREFPQITDLPPHHVNRIPKGTLHFLQELYGVQVVEYFTEPICDIHLRQIIEERQKFFLQVDHPEVDARLMQSVQAAILPLLRENLPFVGHTHGILLKK